MKFLFVPTCYVQVFKNKMIIQVPSENKIIVKEASFSHPRMIIGEFEVAEKLLEAGIKEAYPNKFIPARPQVIIQPKEVIEGGVTMIEERVLMELSLGAGARQARVWVGHDLTKDEVTNFKF